MNHDQVAALTNALLDKLTAKLNLKNDAALSRAMRVAPPVISKLRHARIAFGPVYIITAHKLTGWTILEIEAHLGIENEFATV